MAALDSVLINKSTGSIVKYCPYPRADMAAIEGLDPNYEYLVKYEPFPAPDYDSRYYLLNKVEAITTEPHPVYPHLDVFKTTYTLIKRDVTELEFHLKQAKDLADNALCNTENQLSFTLQVQASFDKVQSGLSLTPEEQSVLDRSRAIKVKLDKNQDNFNLLLVSITAGNEPNMDAGWESA
jgi:hypothetical protein